MVKRRKRLAETDKKDKQRKEDRKKEILLYVSLINKIRSLKDDEKIEVVFNEIVAMLGVKIQQIVNKFTIPGFSTDDIHQEALFALRFKAIKDYDQTRSDIQEISPFDKFAALCIRRHLSTKLKSSYQNKSRILNSSISLDQDRSQSGSEDNLYLSDILTRKHTDIFSDLNEREYRKSLLFGLYSKLSVFEKEVFVLYCQKYSYDEMVHLINKKRIIDEEINVKSIDNALSRLKIKAKKIFEKYG